MEVQTTQKCNTCQLDLPLDRDHYQMRTNGKYQKQCKSCRSIRCKDLYYGRADPKQIAYPQETVDQIVKLRQDGLMHKQIAEYVRLDERTVGYLLNKAGVKRPEDKPLRLIPQKLIDAVCAARKTNPEWLLPEIATHAGCTMHQAKYILRQQGLSLSHEEVHRRAREARAANRGYQLVKQDKVEEIVAPLGGIVLSEYLQESTLEQVLKIIFPEAIIDLQVSLPIAPQYRYDYQVSICSRKILVEFDGASHYNSTAVQLRDNEKTNNAAKLGYQLVRWPYWIQPTPESIEELFGVNTNLVNSTFPHGFISKKCVLPADFNSAGIVRFVNELKKTKLRDVVLTSLHNKVVVMGSRDAVFGLNFDAITT